MIGRLMDAGGINSIFFMGGEPLISCPTLRHRHVVVFGAILLFKDPALRVFTVLILT